VTASLWKFDDRATRELMTAFYSVYWDRTKVVSRVEALRQAQLTMLRDGVKRGR
jgi:CHAT domain-containing protein